MIRILAVMLAAALASAAPLAQSSESTHPPGCGALAGTVSRELMQRPVGLTPAPGRLHQQVTTTSTEAQAYYDQGIAWLASYAWAEAARSLHEAVRRDPDLAMGYLMLAKAYAGAEAVEEARQHLSTASAIAKKGKVTPAEAKWIELGVVQAEAVAATGSRRAVQHDAYKKAIDDLIKMNPGDPHAWILRGNAEEPGAWGRGQVGRVGSIAYYEAALLRDPENLAAHHFLVHSYENIGRHEQAAEHAEVYVRQAAAVPHAQHMYGHVLPRLGRWREALERFSEADRLEREYYKAEGIRPDEDWHHSHNLQLLGTVQLRLGNDAEAERLYKEAFNLEDRNRVRGSGNVSAWPEYLMLRGRSEQALEVARELESRPQPSVRFFGAMLGAEALLELGRVKEARSARRRADAAYDGVLKKVKGTPYETLTPSFMKPVMQMFDAQLDLRGRRPERGEAYLIKVADELTDNPRFDAWGEGLFRLERVAAGAARAGRVDLARQLVERMAKIDPEFKSAALGGAAPVTSLR